MTCVIGLVGNDGDVYIGADSCASNGENLGIASYPKVFRLGELLIGYTSSFRFAQIIQYHLVLKPQQTDQDDYAYMVSEVVYQMRCVLKEHGYTSIQNNREEGGILLAGYRGQLYKIQGDFSAVRYDDFYVIGSGGYVATGAMAALDNLKPKRRIQKALEITAIHDPFVAPPFIIKRLKVDKDAD